MLYLPTDPTSSLNTKLVSSLSINIRCKIHKSSPRIIKNILIKKDLITKNLFLMRLKLSSNSFKPVIKERKIIGPCVLEIREGNKRIVKIRIEDLEFITLFLTL